MAARITAQEHKTQSNSTLIHEIRGGHSKYFRIEMPRLESVSPLSGFLPVAVVSKDDDKTSGVLFQGSRMAVDVVAVRIDTQTGSRGCGRHDRLPLPRHQSASDPSLSDVELVLN